MYESLVRLGRVVNHESTYPNQLEKESTSFFSYQLPFHKDWNLTEVITLEFGSWTTVRWPLYLREPYYGNIFQQIQTFLGSDKTLKKIIIFLLA